jgi:DNA oxidative demethylase
MGPMDLIDDLFPPVEDDPPAGVVVLRARTGLAGQRPAIDAITAVAPFRHLQVPGGRRMSVATTNAGARGWCSDRAGYRYATRDPLSGQPWAPIPEAWLALAAGWAAEAGFPCFVPDCCLINRYAPGARMGAHRDQDEQDFSQPIVSVSLGRPATFVWLGASRSGPGRSISLRDGDVVVFGGAARLGYHAVRPIRADPSAFDCRINLTFRRAG